MGYHIGTREDASHTWYLGAIDISYRELVKKFGEPTTDGDGYKVDAEWILVFDDGEVATLYNYKDGVNYNGSRHGIPKTKIRDWHIGGREKVVIDRVVEILYG